MKSRDERRLENLKLRKKSFERIFSLSGSQPEANSLIKNQEAVTPYAPDGMTGKGDSTLTRQYTDFVYGSYLVKLSPMERIREYYRMAADVEINYCITEIVDEIVQECENKKLFTLKFGENLKKPARNILTREFIDLIVNKLKLGNYNNLWDWVYKFIIQGVVAFRLQYDENKNTGVEGLVEIQPWLISQLYSVTQEELLHNGKKSNKYYVIRESENAEEGFKFDDKEVIKIDCGFYYDGQYFSILEFAKKDWRRLNLIEDSTIIYKLSRSPLRRVFKVYVGKMAPKDVENFLQNFRQRLREDITYDPDKGEIVGLNPITLLDDYFFPVIEGGQSLCEVETLQEKDIGWESMDEIRFFLGKVYRALKIPIGRMNLPNQTGEYTTASQGSKHGEIMRDEIKFSKFIRRLQNRFIENFIQELFYRHLFFRNLISDLKLKRDDFEVSFSYVNPYLELKEAEVEESRLGSFSQIVNSSPLISVRFLMKKYLKWTDEQIDENFKLLVKDQLDLMKLEGEEAGQIGGGGGGAGDLGGGAGEGEIPSTEEAEKIAAGEEEKTLEETPGEETAEKLGSEVAEEK